MPEPEVNWRITRAGGLPISREKWYAKIGYTPRRSQAMVEQAVKDGKRYIGHFTFPRGGKSYGAAKIAGRILLQPDRHAWIVAPNYKLGSKEFGYIWNDMAETGFLAMASRKNFDIRGGNMAIVWPWGSMIEVISAENPASLRAEELDLLIPAEAAELGPEIFHRHLFARLEKRKGLCIIPTTPHGYNWVYETFRIPSLKTLPGGLPNPRYDPLCWSVVVSADPALVNPDDPAMADVCESGIYDDEYLVRARKLLPWPIYLEQVGGSFASYQGLIFQYNPLQHRVPRFEIPDSWTHIVGWDHGANVPTAIEVGSYSPDGTLYWWGEIYEAGLSAKEYYARLKRLLGQKREAFISIDRSAKQVRIELEQLGVPTTVPAEKAILARIIRKTALMRGGKWKVLEGCCPNLEQEILAWEWEDTGAGINAAHGRPREGQRNHALDATGYAELIPVQLPEGHTDPFAPEGEPAEVSRAWKSFRQKMARRQDAHEDASVLSVYEPDPFLDRFLSEEDFVEDAAWSG